MKNLNLLTTLTLSLIAFYAFCQTGTLDATFGTGGIVTTSYLGDNDGEAVAIQADGKIVLVGSSQSTEQNLRVVRYLYNGTVDTSFGSNGTIEIIGLTSEGRGVVIQPDGKIIVSGSSFGGSNAHALLARLNSDGTFDTSFGTNGIVETYIGTVANLSTGLALQADGKIVLGGSAFIGASADFSIVRYNSDGSLDNSFGSAGIVTLGDANQDELSEFVLIQDDGKIVIGGTQYVSNVGNIMVARVHSDGAIDTSFGANGIVLTDVALGNDQGTSGALQTDGKIVVVGNTEINTGPLTHYEFCTLRYTADGILDNTFNVGGIVTSDIDGGVDIGTSVAIQQNGNIVVAGDGEVGGFSQFGMFRYLPDGSLDLSFGTGGKVTTAIGMDEDLCNAMALQPDNGQYIILVGESDAGWGESDFALVRYENTVGFVSLSSNEIPLAVYPNPVNDQSVIEYSLLREEKVSIKLYNLAGELVQTILEETSQQQGEHQQLLQIDGNLAHGNYLLKVEASSSMSSIEINI